MMIMPIYLLTTININNPMVLVVDNKNAFFLYLNYFI